MPLLNDAVFDGELGIVAGKKGDVEGATKES
jgi:hypothetical protein